MFLAAISHPNEVLRARDLVNAPGSGLILDKLAPPLNPTFFGSFGGTLIDRLRDLEPQPELIVHEWANEREVRVTYWTGVNDEFERNIVGAIAYWTACQAANLPLPSGGGVEWAEGPEGEP